MTTSHSQPPQPGGPGLRWRCAYHLIKPSIRDIPRHRLIEIEMDIPTVGRATLGRIHVIRAARSEIATNIPDFDLAIVDRLDLVVRAMCYTHWLWQSTYAAQEFLGDWLRDISQFGIATWQMHEERLHLNLWDTREDRVCPYHRRCLLNSSTANRCILDWWWLADLEAELRYCETAQLELLDELATVMQENAADLDEAQHLFDLERQRAFTYFMMTYDQVRRAIQFVRWRDGDADTIVPSLEPALTRRRCVSQVVPTLRMQEDLSYDPSKVDVRKKRSS